jgi:HD-GYP domain-containing protein (c-di-GMP phosphodiesterase class II)
MSLRGVPTDRTEEAAMAATSKPLRSQGAESRFLPVALDSLDYCALEMNLYLRSASGAEPTLYREAGLEFRTKDAQRLTDQGIKHLYISVAQHRAYRKMLTKKLDGIVHDPKLAHQERWKAVRSSCNQMINDVLLLPGQTEAVEAVGDIGRAFAEWSVDDSNGFSYLLDMSAHDFYTTSHMVNVGVGCGLLVKELKPGDAATLSVIVQGGMLHDVGKRTIPEAILNKEGRLDPKEWALVQKHPKLGFDELVKHESLPPIVPLMARDHHERIDGKGYPQGLSGEAIGHAARVCAVVDVYDAITAARPYRPPIAPADALGMMREGRGTHFDGEIFDAWCAIVGRLVKEDAGRAVQNSDTGAVRPLSDVVATSPVESASGTAGQVPAPDLSADERRRHVRKSYSVPLRVSFVRQGKHAPVPVGQEFDATGMDLSRSGIGVQTPWPLSLGDVLWIQFPSKDGGIVKRYAKVVRVRKSRQGWFAGCCFIELESLAA